MKNTVLFFYVHEKLIESLVRLYQWKQGFKGSLSSRKLYDHDLNEFIAKRIIQY